MNNSCPVNFKRIDSNVSRFTSLIVASLVITYLVYGDVMILYIIWLDFLVRLFLSRENSFFNIVSEKVKKLLKLEDKFVDSGAKQLAGYFGLTFIILLVICHYIDIYPLTLTIAIIYLTCSLLDVFINYCLGCKVYYIIKKVYPSFMS